MRKFNYLYVLAFLIIIYGIKVIFTGEISPGIAMVEDNFVIPYGSVIVFLGVVIFYFAYKK